MEKVKGQLEQLRVPIESTRRTETEKAPTLEEYKRLDRTLSMMEVSLPARPPVAPAASDPQEPQRVRPQDIPRLGFGIHTLIRLWRLLSRHGWIRTAPPKGPYTAPHPR